MTLSNNAIKFLQAQYRAIFKRAYIKGLATAVLLTAGLATGAQAADLSTDKNNPTTDLIIASGETQEFGSSGQYATSVTVNAGGTLESADPVNNDFHFRDSMDVYGTVNVTSGHGIVGTFDDEGYGDGSYNKTGDFTGTLNIHEGAKFSVANSYVQVKDVNINGGTITLSGGIGSADKVEENAMLIANGTATTTGVFTLSDGTINLQDKSQIGGHTTYINGGTVNFEGTQDNYAFIRAAANGDDGIYINGGTLAVAESKFGGIFGKSITMKGGEITVASGGELTLGGDFTSKSAQHSAATYKATNIAISAGSITNAGTLTLGKNAADTLTVTGGSMSNTGTVIVNADELSVTDKYFNGLFTKGTGVTQGKLNFSGSAINVDGAVDLNELGIIGTDGALTTNFTLKDSATLTADTVTLDTLYNTSKLTLNVKTLNVQSATNETLCKNDFGFIIKQGTISVSDSINLTRVPSEVENETPEDRIYVYASSGDATFNMINDGSKAGTVTGVDRFYVGYGNLTKKSTLNIDGNWDLKGVDRINVANSGAVTFGGTVTNLGDIRMEANGKVTVEAGANVSVGRLVDDGAGLIEVNGALTFSGDGIDSDSGTKGPIIDFEINQSTLTINNGGTLAITGDAVDNVVNDSGAVITTNWSGSKVNLKAGGTLSLDLGDITLTQTQLGSLKNGLVNTGYKGSFDFGDSLTINLDQPLKDAIDNGEVSYSQLSGAGINDVKGIADGVTVTVNDTEATNGINLSNGASAVKLASGTTSVAVDGTLMLNSSSGGNFVYTENTPDAPAEVSVKANGAVNLTGNGTVGSLTKVQGANKTSAVLNAGQGATQTVQGEINLGEVTIGTGTVNVTQSVTADELNVNGTLTVSGGAGAVNIGDSGAAIAGTLNAGTITSSGDMAVTGSVLADSIILSGSADRLSVGDSSSSGLVEVETLDLNDGMLLIDPDWTQNASIVTVTGANTDDVIDVGGSIGVGQNSVGVFGATTTEAQESLNRLGLLQSGKLDENGIGAVLYLGNSLAVGNENDVLVDKTMVNAALNSAITGMNTNSGSVTLAAGSALVISESFSNDLVDPSQNKAIFEFAAAAGSTVTVSAESGAEIIFDSADILGGDTVTVANSSGASITTTLDQADISAAGGLLDGTANGNTITFGLAQNAADHLYNQSNPIRDMTLDVVGNQNGAYDAADAGVSYIGAMNAHNGGADIERTARMALYGGAVQATLMAQQTSTDAISERLGMANPNSALIASNNAQGGGLWLSPVYKNHDSDEFEAEGVNYGADIDLYGLALGADFTTESGVRVGAMFNVGSGDAEGQGIGEGVSNDFDYYGFSLYAGVTFGNFALTADAGFTQVSNDLEQAVNYHGVGTLKADTDTQTVSVGVRGEYLFATPWVDVVPHVGVRYTSFDMDSYQAQVDGYTIASADADSMQVFSIPFGVTFSKDMAMGNWVVKPVFDLNLTANAGDDELESDVAFVGVSNVALTTEVMDSFTYGATLPDFDGKM